MPIAKPRRFGPAKIATACRPAGKNNPAPAPNSTWATTTLAYPSAVAAATAPAAVTIVLHRITVIADHRRSATPLTMLNTAIASASAPNAMPPCPSDSPRSSRVVGNSGESSCSPTVAAKYVPHTRAIAPQRGWPVDISYTVSTMSGTPAPSLREPAPPAVPHLDDQTVAGPARPGRRHRRGRGRLRRLGTRRGGHDPAGAQPGERRHGERDGRRRPAVQRRQGLRHEPGCVHVRRRAVRPGRSPAVHARR